MGVGGHLQGEDLLEGRQGDLHDLTGAEAPLPEVALPGTSGYITGVAWTRSHDLFPPLWERFQEIGCFLHALLSRSYAQLWLTVCACLQRLPDSSRCG
jgi:hypothetical protein